MNAYEQMRAALVEAVGETCAGCRRDCDDCLNLKAGWMAKAKAALALPRRQCDVGEVGEQILRYLNYCDEHCPSHGGVCVSKVDCVGGCEIEWAQMPYDESEAK